MQQIQQLQSYVIIVGDVSTICLTFVIRLLHMCWPYWYKQLNNIKLFSSSQSICLVMSKWIRSIAKIKLLETSILTCSVFTLTETGLIRIVKSSMSAQVLKQSLSHSRGGLVNSSHLPSFQLFVIEEFTKIKKQSPTVLATLVCGNPNADFNLTLSSINNILTNHNPNSRKKLEILFYWMYCVSVCCVHCFFLFFSSFFFFWQRSLA